MSLSFAKFIYILKVKADDASFKFFYPFDRVDPRPRQMAGINTCPHPFTSTFKRTKNRIGIPVCRGFRVIMNSNLDLIFLAKPVNQIECVRLRLRDDRLDTHSFGKFKDLTAFGLVVRQFDNTIAQNLHT